jgi:hypothetical protein
MTPSSSDPSGVALLADLRRLGLKVHPEGDRIRISPKTALTPELRQTLVTKKGEVLAALSMEARILQMPLDRFELEGRRIEVRVPRLRETLWFVPTRRDVDILMARGIQRGRIWTAKELAILWRIPDLDQNQVRDIARVKMDLSADIESIEIPDRAGSWITP